MTTGTSKACQGSVDASQPSFKHNTKQFLHKSNHAYEVCAQYKMEPICSPQRLLTSDPKDQLHSDEYKYITYE